MTRLAAARISPGVFSALGAGAGAGSALGAGAASFLAGAAAFLAGAEVLPRRMSPRWRFMALHMIWVSRRPDAPTTPPTATSSGSPMAIPAIEPATPEREFSREIVMGISAPPTRRAKATPKKAESKVQSRQLSHIGIAETKTISAIVTTTRTIVVLRMSLWPFQITGRPLMILCSLPPAIREPVRVIMPTARAMAPVIRAKRFMLSRGRKIRVARATRAEAAPPKPLNRATISGISIILMRAAQSRPTTRPIAVTIRQSQRSEGLSKMPAWNSVRTMAAAMQRAESRLPVTAVLTLLIRAMPTRTPRVRTPQRT